MNWNDFHDALAAWGTFLAAVIALFSAIYALLQVRKQLRIQHDFADRRIEEEYLRRALYVMFDCYNAALVYVSSWAQYKVTTNVKSARAAPSNDQMHIDGIFLDQWRQFDREITATIRVARARARDQKLLASLEELHSASTALFDFLTDDPDAISSEEALEMSDKGAKAKQAADKAADALARRLVELYQVA